MGFSLCSDGSLPIELVRKIRRLPLPGDVLVGNGDLVAPDTPVAKISLRPGIPWVVPAARLLGIEPADLPEAMAVKVGDRVGHKQVYARALRGIYGRKELESPTDGVVEDISARSGRVVIREEFGKEEPPVKVDAAFELGVKPADLPKCMLRKIGDEVKREQIFAKKGEQAAFFTKAVRAPISGIIAEVNTQTGLVTIARPFKEVIIKGYMHGRVAEVLPHRGVVVEAPAVRITGIFGVGRETHGPLRVVVDGPGEVLTEDGISAEHAGCILVGGAHVADEALAKAARVGVKGIIAATASYLAIIHSLGVKLGVGITGQEDTSVTLVLMEGFGHLAMRQGVFDLLKAMEGQDGSINGATQIRAGAIRPEIIVAYPDYAGALVSQRSVDEDLKLGQMVRVISDPHFGALGKIVGIPREPVVIETEAKVPVAEVELECGTRAVVPRANLEVF